MPDRCRHGVPLTRECEKCQRGIARVTGIPFVEKSMLSPVSDPLIDTPAFREAVEAMDSIDADMRSLPSNQKLLLAALPHLERHFRAKLAEELRAEGARRSGLATLRAPDVVYAREQGFRDAADHLEGQ